jgi:hypothetical protein
MTAIVLTHVLIQMEHVPATAHQDTSGPGVPTSAHMGVQTVADMAPWSAWNAMATLSGMICTVASATTGTTVTTVPIRPQVQGTAQTTTTIIWIAARLIATRPAMVDVPDLPHVTATAVCLTRPSTSTAPACVTQTGPVTTVRLTTTLTTSALAALVVPPVTVPTHLIAFSAVETHTKTTWDTAIATTTGPVMIAPPTLAHATQAATNTEDAVVQMSATVLTVSPTLHAICTGNVYATQAGPVTSALSILANVTPNATAAMALVKRIARNALPTPTSTQAVAVSATTTGVPPTVRCIAATVTQSVTDATDLMRRSAICQEHTRTGTTPATASVRSRGAVMTVPHT